MTEAEINLRFQARANPPPILFRYRSPTDWTLAEISKQQIYAAKPDELNDPFECSARVVWDKDLLKRKFVEQFAPTRGFSPDEAEKYFDSNYHILTPLSQDTTKLIREQSGIICLSAVSNSIRMWSYYAKAHTGICIGYDTTMRPFYIAMNVTYKNPDAPLEAVAALSDRLKIQNGWNGVKIRQAWLEENTRKV
jgi:hypothetical protein